MWYVVRVKHSWICSLGPGNRDCSNDVSVHPDDGDQSLSGGNCSSLDVLFPLNSVHLMHHIHDLHFYSIHSTFLIGPL